MSGLIERFSVAEIERRVGVPKRTLIFWTDNDVLRSIADRHSGSGNPRLYPSSELLIAALVGALFTSLGTTIGVLQRFSGIVRDGLVLRRSGTVLDTDEKRWTSEVGRILVNALCGEPGWLLLAHRPPDLLLLAPVDAKGGQASFAEVIQHFASGPVDYALAVLDVSAIWGRLEGREGFVEELRTLARPVA